MQVANLMIFWSFRVVTALRIEKAFGPRLEHLMQMQLAYDVAQARSRERSIRVRKFQSRRT